MLFVEPSFLFVFLPLLLGFYAICPAILRNMLLLFASLIFYALGEKFYVVVMILSVSLNYVLGLMFARLGTTSIWRRPLFVTTIVLNLVPLALFKYASFAVEQMVLVTGITVTLPDIAMHLPIGISFFTFQGLSYVLDVAARRAPAQKNPFDLGLYIAFFPQLIAGPIVRYTQFAQQLKTRVTKTAFVFDGARRFLIGAAKKLLIANPMALVADGIFALLPSDLTPALAWTGAIAYTLQIYFDFSGYSDMAIGLARMFGFRIPRNFNYPYISRSITEFWRRWHISLSSWFRDYLYIPLGGNRGGAFRTYLNLGIVFFLCGLWHGANWGFLLWGIYQGIFLIIERMGLAKGLKKLGAVSHLYALLVTVIGWVLFRASTGPVPGDPISYFVAYLNAMFTPQYASLRSVGEFASSMSYAVALIGIFACTPIGLKLYRTTVTLQRRSKAACFTIEVFGFIAAAVITFVVVIVASADAYNPFIYFQF